MRGPAPVINNCCWGARFPGAFPMLGNLVETRWPDRRSSSSHLRWSVLSSLDSWPFPSSPATHFGKRRLVLPGQVAAVRHHCSTPHATFTAPPHQKPRHTCSGYGSRRSPEPCQCRSEPWPCIQGLADLAGPAGPGPRSVLSQRTQRPWQSARCPFAHDDNRPRFFFCWKCRMLVFYGHRNR